jgi:hydrogenase large subunit
MHQATITNGKITKYQCIVPTTWNGSPLDAAGNHGAIEAAVMGNPWSTDGATFQSQSGTVGTVTTAGGVEVLRAAQSFDPCIACAIH